MVNRRRRVAALVAALAACSLAGCGDDRHHGLAYSCEADFNAFTLPVTRSSSIVIGDVNGDQHADVVTTSYATGEVTVVLADGLGGHQPPMSAPGGSDPLSAVAADFDGDGNLDLAFIEYQGAVGVMLGHGDGTFAPATFYAAGPLAFRMTVGDIDGNGTPDLVVAGEWDGSSPDNAISVLANVGDGTFTTYASLRADATAFQLGLGDFDGNGTVDVAAAVGYPSGGVCVHGNNGDGTFAARWCLLDSQRGDVFGFAIIDQDGDGQLDVALARGNHVVVLRGLGDGTLAPAGEYPVGQRAGQVVAARVDGDLTPDLVLVSDLTISVLLNRGDGTFSGFSQYFVGGVFQSWLAVADLGADGVVDVAVVAQDGIHVLEGRGDGRFGDDVYLGTRVGRGLLGDFDGDGRVDAVGQGSFEEPNVVAISFTVGGAAGLRIEMIPPGSTSATPAVEVGELTGDGVDDILVSAGAGYQDDWVVLEGRTDRTFARLPTIDEIPLGEIEIGDVDGDGWNDLVVTKSGARAGSLAIMRNLGGGAFAPPVDLPGPPGLTLAGGRSALGDVDNDGHLDLVVGTVDASAGTVALATLLGDGAGGFGLAGIHPVTSVGGLESPLLAHLSSDDYLDIVVVEYGDQTVGVLLGHGDGTFGAMTSYPAGTSPTSLAIGNVTGDARPDLVVAGVDGDPYQRPVYILENRGDGSFDPPVIQGKTDAWVSVHTADVDHDDHDDILAFSLNGTVSVWRQRCFARP